MDNYQKITKIDSPSREINPMSPFDTRFDQLAGQFNQKTQGANKGIHVDPGNNTEY